MHLVGWDLGVFFFDKLDGIWVVRIIVRKTLAFEVDETKQGVM